MTSSLFLAGSIAGGTIDAMRPHLSGNTARYGGEGDSRPKFPWWKRPFCLVVAVVTLSLGMAAVSASGEKGLKRLRSLSAEVRQIEESNAEIEAFNTRLSRQIEALRNDPAAQEALAREELGLVRPGDRVFRFEESER